jgi:SAM-dependent methyltransferase
VSARTLKKSTRAKNPLPRMTAKEGFTRHPFDAGHGVQTSGLIPGRLLKAGHEQDRHSTAYFGVAPSVFHALVQRWQRTKPTAPIEQFTFLDFGAGMGRAMLLASEYRFRSVVGVELNPLLVDVARRNLAIWRSERRGASPMRLFQGDVLSARIPRGRCLVFLFNPFGGSVMRRLVKRLAARFQKRAGQLDLLYVNNEQDSEIGLEPGFTRLYSGQVRRSRADAVADHRIMANQPDGEYAASNYEDCSIWRWTGTP